ncbi:MAG: TlpA disulfide reductase family protein, partial [Thioalkalispiraceae bacterium]
MNITKILLIFIFLISSQFIQAESLPINIIPLDKSKAENFIIDDYDGNQYELTSSRGKWVFLHFWASWCGPCRREMPEIYKLQKQLKNKNIDFVLVNTAEDEDTIFSF